MIPFLGLLTLARLGGSAFRFNHPFALGLGFRLVFLSVLVPIHLPVPIPIKVSITALRATARRRGGDCYSAEGECNSQDGGCGK